MGGAARGGDPGPLLFRLGPCRRRRPALLLRCQLIYRQCHDGDQAPGFPAGDAVAGGAGDRRDSTLSQRDHAADALATAPCPRARSADRATADDRTGGRAASPGGNRSLPRNRGPARLQRTRAARLRGCAGGALHRARLRHLVRRQLRAARHHRALPLIACRPVCRPGGGCLWRTALSGGPIVRRSRAHRGRRLLPRRDGGAIGGRTGWSRDAVRSPLPGGRRLLSRMLGGARCSVDPDPDPDRRARRLDASARVRGDDETAQRRGRAVAPDRLSGHLPRLQCPQPGAR